MLNTKQLFDQLLQWTVDQRCIHTLSRWVQIINHRKWLAMGNFLSFSSLKHNSYLINDVKLPEE